MKVTYLTEHNQFNPDAFSGTSFWIPKGLESAGVEIDRFYVNMSLQLLPLHQEIAMRLKKIWIRFYHRQQLLPDYFTQRAMYVAEQLKKPLQHCRSDIILTSITPISAAFLETKIPIVYWTDVAFSSLVGFYPEFRHLSVDTQWDGHLITDATYANAKLLIFSSEWAARSAIDIHGIKREKVKVVPFGANMPVEYSVDDIKQMIKARSTQKITFLFVGKEWYRKGGDIVLQVLDALSEAGYPVELTILGEPYKDVILPSYARCEGLISKKTPEDAERIQQYYRDAHFLFVPSRAEAFGIVFCEASAHGVPSLSTYVGGIPDVIKDGINGMKFSLHATVKEYCDYIVNLWNHPAEYEALALSSFNEYQMRLNWKTSSEQVKQLMQEII